ncbi:MAG: septal ring lytic transglycosylase RlpA family protein [Bacteroidales bacterium]|nr:septal ring lytic transglycosylase RlpA family protein [Bacteroidales bacterium]
MVKSLARFVILCVLFLYSWIGVFAQEKKDFTAKATYYQNRFENRRTSSGEIFSQKKYTAAHKTLPLNTLVRVTHLSNGRSVLLKVNDRCPRAGVIDLSYIAAQRILLHKTGTAKVKVELLGDEYMELWEKQNDLFEMFDRAEMNDSVRNRDLDSVIFAKGNKYEQTFLFTYYVRLATAANKNEAKMIIHQLPEIYKNRAKAVKVYNENFYYINIGPFISVESAEDAVENLKKNYPLAHLIKKKDN